MQNLGNLHGRSIQTQNAFYGPFKKGKVCNYTYYEKVMPQKIRTEAHCFMRAGGVRGRA